MNKLWRLLRHDWPLHFVLLLTNWLPDNVVFLRLRGFLAKPFLGSCGKDLRLGRNITLYNPAHMHIGDHVYLAYGCWLLAADEVKIGDEVLFGPYTVLSSGNHSRMNGSFRFGEQKKKPIIVGHGSWIGAHATILGGATIGKGSLVASGATVVRGIYPDDAFLAGVPAVFKNKVKDGKA